jgi:hypothetical protein
MSCDAGYDRFAQCFGWSRKKKCSIVCDLIDGVIGFGSVINGFVVNGFVVNGFVVNGSVVNGFSSVINGFGFVANDVEVLNNEIVFEERKLEKVLRGDYEKKDIGVKR